MLHSIEGIGKHETKILYDFTQLNPSAAELELADFVCII
jgi:hypothetical protein